ncbi:MAG: hypothetical protein RLY70_2759 [Planctomycetota bacterium]
MVAGVALFAAVGFSAVVGRLAGVGGGVGGWLSEGTGGMAVVVGSLTVPLAGAALGNSGQRARSPAGICARFSTWMSRRRSASSGSASSRNLAGLFV